MYKTLFHFVSIEQISWQSLNTDLLVPTVTKYNIYTLTSYFPHSPVVFQNHPQGNMNTILHELTYTAKIN